jgi:uncharacterized membrane protein
VFAAALVVASLSYTRVAVGLDRRTRATLIALRALALVVILICLLRPVTYVQAAGVRDSIVPVIVDISRSMRLDDSGAPRIERARELARSLLADIGKDYKTELLTFGESLGRSTPDQLSADARRSDLSGALAALAERYRGQRLAGIVVLSDGGDTAAQEAGTTKQLGVPVFAIGVGDSAPARDREVINLTAGEPLLSDSSVDLSVTVTSSGLGTTPFQLRLTENGRPIETRQVAPSADGAPHHELFTVSPSPDRATVYGVEVPVDSRELVTENNTRRILVPPQGRRRRVLVIEGAPGFEHTFLKRALARDQSLDVDAVVRKGRNDQGRDTFFIQAGSGRSNMLAAGFPTARADLFSYDAVVFGNIEGDFFSRDQLDMTADFVAARGGGLLVLGAKSFERAGLVGTPLEAVLPLDLTDRRGAVARTASGELPSKNGTALTADGATHPATRLAVTVEESQKRWTLLPPLASVAATGTPRPGAQVLAVTTTGSTLLPLITIQRYGLGRSMVFAGEASWRWRMMLPANDTTYELIWRQLVRWLASGAVDRVEIPPTSVTLPGTTESIPVLVRDEEFKPVGNAEVSIRVTDPGGQERSLPAALADPREGRYTAAIRFDQAGVYTIAADARRGPQPLGSATRAVLIGGSDVELSEPRLNEQVLRRMAETTGGRYVAEADAASVPGSLREAGIGSPPMEMRDLWNNGWSLAVIVAVLAAEWLVRRKVGLA